MPASDTQLIGRVRRPHCKSRGDCERCKCKKIKCDEIKPTCGNCSKYDVECVLAPVTRRKSAAPKTQSNILMSRSEAFSSIINMTISTPSDRLLELRLIHHFTIICAETLFRFVEPWRLRQERHVANREMATRWIVDLALQDEDIMNAIFAFSAFNHRHTDPMDKQLQSASNRYTTQAITAHADQIRQEIWSRNAEKVFAASLLITFIAVHSSPPEGDDDGLPLHWFKPWQGVRAVRKLILREVVKSSLGIFHTQEIKDLLDSELCLNLPHLDTETRLTTFDFLLDGLDYENTDAHTILAYEKSIRRLAIVHHNPQRDYLFSVAAKVGPRFVRLLEEKDPRALTIVGYYFMLLKSTDDVWWLPRPSVEDFWKLMKLLPEEWRSRMWWAVNEFSSG